MSSVSKAVGQRIKTFEDLRFITGKGNYLDDIRYPDVVYAAILRSTYAHAKIRRIATEQAEKVPGVLTVVTGKQLATVCKPIVRDLIKDYPIAVEHVRYQGEPVAAVVAERREIAEDALELVEVDYEELPVVTTIDEARKPDAPLVYEELGSNEKLQFKLVYGNVEESFQKADRVVKGSFYLHRYSGAPLETYAVLADLDSNTGVLTLISNTQFPGKDHETVCKSLGLDKEKLHLKIPDIGGGYGIKGRLIDYEIIVSALALAVKRPVKWIEERRDHMMASAHAADAELQVEAAVNNDGTFLALKLKDYTGEGPSSKAVYLQNKLNILTSCYRIKNFSFEGHDILTNRGPTEPNRGVGKPAVCFFWERMMDIAGKELGIDPIKIRLRNYVLPEEFPYTTPNGNIYDSGDYPTTLKKSLELVSYDELRKQQLDARKKGRYIGIGISTSVTSSLGNPYRTALVNPKAQVKEGLTEGATVALDTDGRVSVSICSVSLGTSHETTTAQVVGDELGIAPEFVSTESTFDSTRSPWTSSSGSYSNKFAALDLTAIVFAARELRGKILEWASELLNKHPNELEISEGRVREKGTDIGLTFGELAQAIAKNRRLKDEKRVISVTHTHEAVHSKPPTADGRLRASLTFGNASNIAVVDVDPETGRVRLLKYLIVHDCGRIINPLVVEGMLHGGAMSAIGAALGEEFAYDKSGQLLTSTFIDYMAPTAPDVPDVQVVLQETPSIFTPLGTKGVGESGAVPPLAAIANAVEDALEPFDVKINSLPLTPESVWRLIHH